jgi:hypothetical protein
MSSTSNVQNLLVNLLRPTYRYDPVTGAFTPSLSMSNVTELIAGRIQTGSLTVTDGAINTFLGSNSGINVSNAARNVGIGYNAMAGAVNASSNVAIGFNSLEGVSNSSCNVAIGAGTDISDGATRSVLIGPNVTLGGGSNNILIGTNLARGTVNNQLQIGTLLYGDLSSGFIGVNTSAPRAAFDISGITLFNNKVGFQVPNPQFSLDVAGTVYATERFFGSNGTAKAPLYSFKDISGTGMYVPPSTDPYPPGSFGISANGQPIAIFSQNRVQFLRDLDVSGLFSSGTVAFATFAVTNGSVLTPAMTFTTDLSTGFYRPVITNLADVSQQLGVAVGSREVIRLTSRGDVSLQQLLVRDISSSGAFVSSAVSASNQIGGVTLFNLDLCMSATGRILGSSTASNWIGGVTLFANDVCLAPTGRILGAPATSNSIGGITFFNSDLSMSATGLLLAPIVRNAPTATQFDISGGTISNSGTHIAGNFLGTASTSNQIGGVTLFNTDLSMSATGRILGSSTSSNSIGGVTFSNTTLTVPGFFRDISSIPLMDISQGNIRAVGSIQAGPDEFLVAVGDVVSTSAGTGQPWVTRSGLGGNSVAWNRSLWVAVRAGSLIQTSPDAVTWTTRSSPLTTRGNAVAWGNGLWIAVGTGTTDTLATSTDGITWTGGGNPGSSTELYGAAWTGTQWIAVGTASGVGRILTSPDGTTWTAQTNSFTYALAVAVDPVSGRIVVVGENGLGCLIATSTDSTIGTWTTQQSGPSGSLEDVAWNGSLWVAVGRRISPDNGFIYTSSDATTWTSQTCPITTNVAAVAWNGSQWTVGGFGTFTQATSPDGVTWTGANPTGAVRAIANRFGLPFVRPVAFTGRGDLVYTGSLLGSSTTSNQIGGVTLFNRDLCMSATGRILGSSTTSNSIGGITFSNSDVSMSATGRILAPIVRNALVPTLFDISQGNISNLGLTRSSNFRGANGTVSGPTYSFVSDPSSGVFLSDLSTLHLVTGGVRRLTVLPVGDVSLGRLLVADLSASGAILSAFSTANTIGGVTLANGVVTTPGGISTTNLAIPGYIRDAVVPVNLDINGGNISNSGTTTSARFRGAAGSATIPTVSFVTDSSTGLHLGAGGSYLAFDTSGLQRMCISGALVGIGTSAPMSLLDLSDGTLSLRRRIAVADNRASLEVGGGYDSTLATGVPAIAFQSNAGGFRHFIRSRHAAVADSTSNGIDFFLNRGTTNTDSIAPGTNNAIGLSVTAQGVGIATIRPAYALDVSGAEANIQSGVGTGTLYLGGPTTGLYLQRDLTGNGYLRPLASDVSLFLGAKDSNTMTVGTTAVTVGTGISFQSSGTVRATTLNVASDISATGALFSSFGSNNIGGVTLCNGFVITSGTTTSSNLVVPGYLRDNAANPTLDISSGIVRAQTFLGTAATSSNQIGGVTFSNMDLSMSATGLLLAPVLRNARTATQYDISGGNLSNAGTTRSANFLAVPGGPSRPGYAFTSDLSTGMDLGGTSYLAFETGGVQRMCISGGIVGIGTAAPNAESVLDVSGRVWLQRTIGANTNLVILADSGCNSGTAGGRFGIALDGVATGGNGGSDLTINTYDNAGLLAVSKALTLQRSNGNIGLGRAPLPDSSMCLITPSNRYIGTGRLYLGDAPNASPAFGSTFIEGLSNNAGGGGACDLLFYSRPGGSGPGTDPRERMRISGQTGTVAIGTTAPNADFAFDVCGGLNARRLATSNVLNWQVLSDLSGTGTGYRYGIGLIGTSTGDASGADLAITAYDNANDRRGDPQVLVQRSSGRVGIGTLTPQYRLDTASNGTIRGGELRLTSNGIGYGALKIQGSVANHTMLFQDVCTTAALVQTAGYNGWLLGTTATAYGSDPTSFHMYRVALGSDAANPTMTFQRNGNVGIGASNPPNLLFVRPSTQYGFANRASRQVSNYQVAISDGGGAAPGLYLGSYFTNMAGAASTIQASDSWDGSINPTTLLLNPGGGSIGIGTTSPSQILDVSGIIRVFDDGRDVMGLLNPKDGNHLRIGAWNRAGAVSKDIVMNIDGGNVGINKVPSGHKLDVNGTISASCNEYTVYLTAETIVSVPSGFTQAHVTLVGAGGGGGCGGSNTTGAGAGGGGGGGGGAGWILEQLITNPASMTFMPGEGGFGGTPTSGDGGRGGAGGASTLTFTGLSSGTMRAPGGLGGAGGAAGGGTANGGAGGVGYYGGGGGGAYFTGTGGSAGSGTILPGTAGGNSATGNTGGAGGSGGGGASGGVQTQFSGGSGGGGGGPAGGTGGSLVVAGTIPGVGCGGGGGYGKWGATGNGVSGRAGGIGYAIIKFLR